MKVPQQVSIIKEEGDLDLYHYDEKNIQHPSDADDWKGIVMYDNMEVAKSFAWAPTYVDEELPTNLVYTRLYEATLLRFYRFDGKPMISTHKQINISDKSSRATPSSRPFITLVEEAIRGWKYSTAEYSTVGGMGYAFTPTSWEELCMDDWCHVFLLVDQSNQITDLYDLTKTSEIVDENGDADIITTMAPKLIHSISYKRGYDLDTEDNIFHMTHYLGQPTFDGDDRYIEYKWLVPELKVMVQKDAVDVLDNGGAVVGFSLDDPYHTYKYLSESYDRKLELAGETFNPVHRWHQLMDVNPNDAQEYLTQLPWHLKHINQADMYNAVNDHINNISSMLAANIALRYNGKDASLDPAVYKKSSAIITSVLSTLRDQKLKRNTDIEKLANRYVAEIVSQMSFSDRHALNRVVSRMDRESK